MSLTGNTWMVNSWKETPVSMTTACLETILAAYFHGLSKQLPIRAFTGQRMRVAAGEGRQRFRIPDVCVVLRPYRKEPVLTEAPLITIEILSPDDTVTSMMDRLQDYL